MRSASRTMATHRPCTFSEEAPENKEAIGLLGPAPPASPYTLDSYRTFVAGRDIPLRHPCRRQAGARENGPGPGSLDSRCLTE